MVSAVRPHALVACQGRSTYDTLNIPCNCNEFLQLRDQGWTDVSRKLKKVMQSSRDFMLEQLPDFSPWFKFHERRIHTTILDQHGVYVLAHFEAPIAQERANPLASEVFYAGKAYPGTAEARLNEFEEAAFHGKDDHDAGTCYRTRFPSEDGTKLYAAIYPPIRPIAKLHESHIAHVENEIVKRYKTLQRHKPICNEIMPPRS